MFRAFSYAPAQGECFVASDSRQIGAAVMRGAKARFDGRPSIAIIGSGLAGGLLASELGSWAKVTVYERGSEKVTYSTRPRVSGHPLGLYPSFAYGLGGTTNLWRGSLLAMHRDEYKQEWPDDVQKDLKAYQCDLVNKLYGAEALQTWSALRPNHPQSKSFITDTILKFHGPFRIKDSNFFSQSGLRLNHCVRYIDESANRAVVHAVHGTDLRRCAFDAVVVCAGGLNSPLILRRSLMGGKVVGENLTDHPMGFVAKLTARPGIQGFRQLNETSRTKPVLKIADAETGLWSSFQLSPTEDAAIDSDPYKESFEAIGSRDRVLRYGRKLPKLLNSEFRAQVIARLLHRHYLGRHAYVLVMSEQEAFGQGSVREDSNGSLHIDWTVSETVVSAIGRSLTKLAEWLGAELHCASDLRNRLWSAAHYSGGCRLSNNADLGAVDRNLRVHDTRRVFVCDGSVLPSTGASNTGLAIGSLSLRLAAHLKSQFA